MLDIYDFYDRMEHNKIMLSFKGNITSELLTSILSIMESKLDNLDEPPKVKKKVYNVLVEVLQNLYHHMDEVPGVMQDGVLDKSALFMIGKVEDAYRIFTGNFILAENVEGLKEKILHINKLERDELKAYYKEVLNNGEMSMKGGGGLGLIDIAKKSGQKLGYDFMDVDDNFSFFTLNINIVPTKKIAE